jgi:hypothetical protein
LNFHLLIPFESIAAWVERWSNFRRAPRFGLWLFVEAARGAAGPVRTGPDVSLNFHRRVPFRIDRDADGLRLFVEAAHGSARAVGAGLHVGLNFHVNSPLS